MVALTEVTQVRQVRGEPRRRWFMSRDLDLVVWCDEAGSPIGFQLCYRRNHPERALTWKPELGFAHTTVDDGEAEVGLRYKGTPILVGDGDVDANWLSDQFAEESARLPAAIVEFVATKLRQHPNYVPGSER